MSRKVIQTIVLLLLLVGLPLISWIFLNDGLKFILSNRERLAPKASIPELDVNFEAGVVQIFYPLDTYEGRLMPLVELLKDRGDVVRFVEIENIKGQLLDSLDKVAETLNLEGDIAFLVDTKGAIVQGYEVTQDQDMGQLSQDVVFLLPPEEKKDYHMRREREK